MYIKDKKEWKIDIFFLKCSQKKISFQSFVSSCKSLIVLKALGFMQKKQNNVKNICKKHKYFLIIFFRV